MKGWDFAVPDWRERLESGRSLVPDLPLDAREAARAIGIFDRLRLPDVPGQPANADAAGDWFRDIVRAVFGSIDADGARRVPEVFTLVPKKNSKTTGGAAIMLTALLMNQRPHAEFLLVGPTQAVADLAFEQCAGMISADPDGYLQQRFHTRRNIKTIEDLGPLRARLKVKTFDMRVMTGVKPSGVLVDELHVMSKHSYAGRVIGQIRGGLLPNPEGFLVFITTQSDEPPAGVFESELHYAREVRDGEITESVRMLPILYEFPVEVQTDPQQPWRDPKLWPLVLPNLGRSITLERLKTDADVAKAKGEAEWRRWASQHLNIEIGVALGSDRWRGADHWEVSADPSISDLDAMLARCEVAVIGIDGGGLDDLLGVNVTGRDRETQEWLAWHRAFAQSDVLTLRKDIAERLRDFENDGDLVFCEIGTADLELVADIVSHVHSVGLLPEKYAVGFDPQGVAAMVDELASRGIAGDMVVAVPQGYRLSNAIWGMERKLRDGTYKHGGKRLMNWCVGNAKIEQRGSAVLMTKQAAGRAKIDPLIAAMNAFHLMARNPVAMGAHVSPWEDPEFSYAVA